MVIIATLAPASWIPILMGWECKNLFAIVKYLRSTDNVLLAEKGEQLSISRNLYTSLEAKMAFKVIGGRISTSDGKIGLYTGVSH